MNSRNGKSVPSGAAASYPNDGRRRPANNTELEKERRHSSPMQQTQAQLTSKYITMQ